MDSQSLRTVLPNKLEAIRLTNEGQDPVQARTSAMLTRPCLRVEWTVANITITYVSRLSQLRVTPCRTTVLLNSSRKAMLSQEKACSRRWPQKARPRLIGIHANFWQPVTCLSTR